ncbi:ABC transporter permease [candidate division KSB1 bacterium]|nr:ABC transporter permease [candidate division KSB1 bacterium]
MRKELIVGPIVFLLIWALFSYLKIVNPVLIPTPWAVIVRFTELFYRGEIWADLLATLYRLLFGFALSIVVGIPLGLILGSSKRLSDSFEFLIDFFRSIPASALFPMFLLFFGIGDKAKVSVVVFSCSLIIIIYTMYGVRNCKESRIRVAKVMKANKFSIFTKVIFPESLPHIFAGVRISISIALILVVVTEMFIGTKYGLGRLIYDSHLMFRLSTMYAAILIAGILGYMLNKIFMVVESKVFHWAGK